MRDGYTRLASVVVIGAVCLMATAWTASPAAAESPGRQTWPPPAAPTPHDGVCPKHLGYYRTVIVPGMTDVLVPGSPDSFTYCQNGNAASSTDQAATQRVQASLNSIPLLPANALTGSGCPGNQGPQYGVFFHYPSGEVMLVYYYGVTQPCSLLTNGVRTGEMTGAVNGVILESVDGSKNNLMGDSPWIWVGVLIVLVAVATGAWWARRNRTERDLS